ncbi:hypothetical protein BDN71DRAFT_1528229 [Pleurotus eryngii]|uniref:Uncharacterized protein n=1 Tax=Pleurotus eryngii TaxID=5323 RepID=A0A9P5ZLZ3_PLEER|nr:hypothetical protein BDN71DRAFT_1528229 [Pleurotus eryngii]
MARCFSAGRMSIVYLPNLTQSSVELYLYKGLTVMDIFTLHLLDYNPDILEQPENSPRAGTVGNFVGEEFRGLGIQTSNVEHQHHNQLADQSKRGFGAARTIEPGDHDIMETTASWINGSGAKIVMMFAKVDEAPKLFVKSAITLLLTIGKHFVAIQQPILVMPSPADDIFLSEPGTDGLQNLKLLLVSIKQCIATGQVNENRHGSSFWHLAKVVIYLLVGQLLGC